MGHRLITILLIFLNVTGIPAFAGVTVPSVPIISIDPIITTDSVSCILPFTRAGNLILIQAKADTATGFFVLDTGVQASLPDLRGVVLRGGDVSDGRASGDGAGGDTDGDTGNDGHGTRRRRASAAWFTTSICLLTAAGC